MNEVGSGFFGYSHEHSYGLSSQFSEKAWIAWASWMQHSVPQTEEYRMQIRELLKGGLEASTVTKITEKIVNATQIFEDDLQRVLHITFSEYQIFLSGLFTGDEAQLNYISALSESRMKRNANPNLHTGRDAIVTEELLTTTSDYIEQFAVPIPRIKGMAQQDITVGAQGWGKTEFRHRHLPDIEHTHILVDIDHIREWYANRLGLEFDGTNQVLIERLRAPCYYIADALSLYAYTENKNLYMDTNLARSTYWLDPRNPIIAESENKNTILHKLMRPEYHGYIRASMRDRKVAPGDYLFALSGVDNVVPFAHLTGATVKVHDFSSYIQEKTNLFSPYFLDRQENFLGQLQTLPGNKVDHIPPYHEELDIHGSVLDVL